MSIWKPIKMTGVPERFVASDDGLIKTLEYETAGAHNGKPFVRRMPERILKPRINKQSPSLGRHPVVGIYTGSSRQNMTHREIRVAKLVAVAFHGLPYDDPMDQRQVQRWKIRFRDEDLLNCSANNLEWVYNTGQDGSEGKTQTTYEKNLDAWNATESSAVLSRLFGYEYEKESAA